MRSIAFLRLGDLDVLLVQVERALRRRLDADVDVRDPRRGVLRQDVLVAQDVVDAGLHQQLDAAAALDEEVEDRLPSLPVRRRRLVGEHRHPDAVAVAQVLHLLDERERVAPAPGARPELLLRAERAALRAAPRGRDDGEVAGRAGPVPVGRPVEQVPGALQAVEVAHEGARGGAHRHAVSPERQAGDPVVALPGRGGPHELGEGELALAAHHEVHRRIVAEDLLPAEGGVHVSDDRLHVRVPLLRGLADDARVRLGGGDRGRADDVRAERLDVLPDVLVRQELGHRVEDLDVGTGGPGGAREVDEVERKPRAGRLDDPGVVRRRDQQDAWVAGHLVFPGSKVTRSAT